MAWETSDGSIFVVLSPSKGSKQKGVYYPRIGTLGGCAAHNALFVIVSHDEDWRRIVEITGDISWAPEHMRKYLEKLEKYQCLPEGTPDHRFNGRLETEHADPAILDYMKLSLASA